MRFYAFYNNSWISHIHNTNIDKWGRKQKKNRSEKKLAVLTAKKGTLIRLD